MGLGWKKELDQEIDLVLTEMVSIRSIRRMIRLSRLTTAKQA